ncbi:MAG: hypothetical protein AAGG68_05970 [Bacteroidota bacterium]
MQQYIFTESNLQFHFHDNWTVRKYDEHPFYQAMSGVGMSAVDFVGIHPSGKLFLMEVKNFNNRSERENLRTLDKLEGDSPLLLEILEEKAEETQKGIRAISRYLHRKWWYRTRFKLLNSPTFQTYLLQIDRLFWMKAAQILEQFPNQVQVVLWLELPVEMEDQRAILRTHLSKYYMDTLPNATIWSIEQHDSFVEIK